MDFLYLDQNLEVFQEDVDEVGLPEHQGSEGRGKFTKHAAVQSLIRQIFREFDYHLGGVEDNRGVDVREPRQHPIQNVLDLLDVRSLIVQ